MGIFDKIFKKKEENKENTEVTSIKREQQANMPAFRTTSNGMLQAEYLSSAESTQREFYDTTKLTIDTDSKFSIAGQTLYNCVVAWDGMDDCVLFDELDKTEISGKREDYKGVWLELDLDKLQTDPEYCRVLMDNLLLRSRVNKLIEMGLQENPERPCGKYIGGVREVDGVYTKYFNATVGREAHQTEFMRERRERLRIKEQERKTARIEANKRKMAELEKENEGLLEK